jgi:DNA polymerase-3 subunit gamma/tau
MSRCQRFDFRRIGPEDSLERLTEVVQREGIEVDPEALTLVVQGANGSLRDALGLLDQALAYAQGRISAGDVRQALGLTDPELVLRLTDHLLDGAVGPGLEEAAAFVAAGGDAGQLVRQFVDYWRFLLLRAAGVRQRAWVDPALEAAAQRHVPRLTTSQVTQVLQAMMGQDFSARYNLPPELPFEVGYVEAALDLQSPTSRQSAAPPIHRDEVQAPAPPVEPATTAPPPQAATPSPRTAQAEQPAAVEPQVSAPGEPLSPPRDLSDLDAAWSAIVSRMRSRSKSLEAILKSGYILGAEDGEMKVGFLYRFHCDRINEVSARRALEEVIAETLGVSYRVRSLVATKEEIEAARGSGSVADDDGFIEEAAESLRRLHIERLGNGHS